MSAILLPWPLAKFFAVNTNLPLSGGKVYTYLAGTSTPQASYSDSAGLIPNTNPVILNSNGEASIYLSALISYKINLTDANDVQIPGYPVDNIIGDGSQLRADLGSSNTNLGVSLVNGAIRVVDSIAALKALSKAANSRVFVSGYYSAGDGGGGNYWYDSTDITSADNGGSIIVAADGGRWKLINNGQISVKQFGAKGNGIADDTQNIQNAINYLITVGGTLYFPNGKYIISGTGLIVDQSALSSDATLTRINIVGDGRGNTEIVYPGTGSAIYYKGSSVSGGLHAYFNLEDLRITGAAGNGNGVLISNGSSVTLSRLTITGFLYGILGYDILSSQISNCSVLFNINGVTLQRQSTSNPNSISFENNIIGNNAEHGISIANPTTVSFTGGSIEGNGITGVGASRGGIIIDATVIANEGAFSASFDSVYFEANTDNADIWFIAGSTGGPTGILVEGCTFNRASPTTFVTNNIRVDVGASFFTTLTVIGCGFAGFNGYTPNSGRPYIAVNGASNNWRVTELGNIYQSSIEKPVLAGPNVTPKACAAAWVRFNGSTGAIGDSFNVASINKTATGNFTINFQKDLASVNYAIAPSINGAGNVFPNVASVGSLSIVTKNAAGADTDFTATSVIIFGGGQP